MSEPTKEYWRFRAELDTADPKLLGEDENGDLYVPSRKRPGWWLVRFNPRNPLHWRAWLRSRRKLKIAMIESVTP